MSRSLEHPSRRSTAPQDTTATPMLPALADPAHGGMWLVRHIGVAIAILLGGTMVLLASLSATVQLTVVEQAPGVIAWDPQRCSQTQAAPPQQAWASVPWRARLWVDPATRARLAIGMPVVVRILPQGPGLQGTIVALQAMPAANPGAVDQVIAAPAVAPEARPQPAPCATAPADLRPVTGELRIGTVSAGKYLLKHWRP